jgi:hypothetical protein
LCFFLFSEKESIHTASFIQMRLTQAVNQGGGKFLISLG